jgi:NADH dehydrogenase [ubiquinone] 1 alpha subcomplex assembly factor 6
VSEPSLVLLSQANQNSNLSRYHLTRLIKAYQSLANQSNSIQTLQHLADWSGATQASILYLLLQATNHDQQNKQAHSTPFVHSGDEHQSSVQPSPPNRQLSALDFDHAASHLAVTLAIEQLIRQIPLNAKHRVNLIPSEIGARFGLTDEGLFRHGPSAVGLGESVANLVGIARNELKTSRECLEGGVIPKERIPIFLGSVYSNHLFDSLDTNEVAFNPFHPKLAKRDWKLPFNLLFKNYFKRY